MKRREAIKYTALSFGAILGNSYSSPILAKTLSLFQDGDSLLKPKYFNAHQFEILNSLIDVIIPETDTPSASQVGVGYLMDSIIAEVMNDDEQSGFMINFDAMEAFLIQNPFLNLELQQKTDILTSVLSNKIEVQEEVLWAIQTIRAFCIDLYLATEEIAKEHLNYLPVPGKYEPCIEISAANNTRWAI